MVGRPVLNVSKAWLAPVNQVLPCSLPHVLMLTRAMSDSGPPLALLTLAKFGAPACVQLSKKKQMLESKLEEATREKLLVCCSHG